MTTFTAQNRTQGVRGTSIINNKLRVKLSLSMEEYALLEAIHEAKEKKKPLKYDDVFSKTGIPHDTIIAKVAHLEKLNFLKRNDQKKIIMGERWMDEFKDVAEHFETFWEIYKKRGNKADALRNYRKAVQLVDREVLHEKAHLYVESVLNTPGSAWKHIMHGAKWLNPESRHWEDEIEPPDNAPIYRHKDD